MIGDEKRGKAADANGLSSANVAHDDAIRLADYPSHSIAVVGMAGRFPDADSVDELWELLLEGRSAVKPADVERLQLPQTGRHANVAWWGNWLRDPEAFDHRFFRKSSREAIAWDPQQRILLQVVYEALESAGHFGPSSTPEPDDYGCYIGAVMNSYYDNLSCHPPTTYATIGTGRCFLSGCMSHYFGWTGPSLTIDTACSSSLVAINTACRAIWSGECSRAIAGGTNVISSPGDYQNLQTVGFLSPTGQCKPFDASADGYCRGEGVGVVVLKLLSDAVRDNDNILGVILGSAANQNRNFSHITVPHSDSQVDLYHKVMKLGNVTPGSVTYVEAHGTGTLVGDPVEVRSIRDAYGGPQRDSPLYLGSIKGNIGHTESAAGVSGLIKVLLMMRHGQIPKQANYSELNPAIPSLEPDRMVIPTSAIPWDPPIRLACVNSHGAAGSNSSLIIRERPPLTKTATPVSLEKYPFILTAGSLNSLSMYSKKLLDWLKEDSRAVASSLLASLTFNLADRANHALPHVLSTSVSSIQDLSSKLEAAASGSGMVNTVNNRNPVVLVFGGQESDFVGLSRGIFSSSKVFRKHLDICDEILVSKGLESLYPAIFESETTAHLVTLHSALFAVQYASARAWMECGLSVDGVVGHSFGQLTALCISGCLSLPDTLTLVTERASLMQRYWGEELGTMMAMQTDRTTVEQVLKSLKDRDSGFYAEIACYNGPRNHVVVGSSSSIESLEQYIDNNTTLRGSVGTRRLRVTHGFHSSFTETILPHLTAVAKQLDWRCPTLHLETCDDVASVTEPDFNIVSRHTRLPVFFQQAVERLTTRFSKITWVEAGRGSSVIQLVKGSVPDTQGHVFLSPQLAVSNAQGSLADVTVELWKSGYAAQHWPFHRSQKPEFEYLSLPPYQFEKTRHWLPYKRRAPAKEPERVEVGKPPELISFLQFKDKSGNEALFKVDPRSDRFQTLVGSHVIAGETLVPAALFFELIARAALFLQEGETGGKDYVPTVDDLAMQYPIGCDISTEIIVTLKRLEAVPPSWAFNITTKDGRNQKAEPSEQSTGKVSLKERGDAQAARVFKRFQSIADHRRYTEVLNHPDSERMQGKHLYRAFSSVVNYGECFRGVKEVACMGHEAVGRVVMTLDPTAPAHQRLCDATITDSFMQFAGFLVNYFNNPSLDDILLCMHIEHAEIGGNFNPDAGEWIVYAKQNEDESDASSDIYVFEAESKRMVMTVWGCRFMKMRKDVLARILRGVNQSGAPRTEPAKPPPQAIEKTGPGIPHYPLPPAGKAPSKRDELFQILSNVTDLPRQEVKGTSTLQDLGIDSLMATEVLNDIRAAWDLNIDLTSFLFFPSIDAIAAHVDEALGVGGGDGELNVAPPSPDGRPQANPGPLKEMQAPVSSFAESVDRLVIASAYHEFEKTRMGYDRFAESTKAVGFWSEAYPHQARLVLAYVVETFAELGCGLTHLRSGDAIPGVKALDKHKQLMHQLQLVLEDGNLISSTDRGLIRTDVPIDETPSETIYHQVHGLYPQHDIVLELVRSVGPRMASCLVGEQEGLQVIFGDKKTKKALETMYEFWPLLRAATLLLGEFLLKIFANANGTDGKLRILEVGAGTGGTTRYLVSLLREHGVPFEYVFTDLSSSLVAAARKQFRNIDGMSFEVLDIEKPARTQHKGAFHCIIATNCIHATKDLVVSLSHLREMLSEDGALTLVETTRNMFWLDIVVGLLEGWWRFEDGRSHALVDEKHWERALKRSGFGSVLWSDGTTPESKTVRIIGAFPRAHPAQINGVSPPVKTIGATLETVVYKKVGDQEIHADVYYPAEGMVPGMKLPIGKKDIRPAQTNLLLEKGFLPVSLDHRLCPEVSLSDGPMVDICDALHWARHTLPEIASRRLGHQARVDGERVVVVGWSSGGQLAMSLGWTAPQRGLRPPEAILAFYCPTDYDDEWWRYPIQPVGAADRGEEYDVLEAVRDEPITNYGEVGAWEPLSDLRIHTDPRCRIVLHINWKAQTLPVILGGLPSRRKAAQQHPEVEDWNALPQPGPDKIAAVSPLAQIRRGNYRTPTFLIHGTADDLIPWQQSRRTYEAMVESNVPAHLALVEGGPHICDRSSEPDSEGWKATVRGYEFIASHVF
ncbi:Type I Iterative PKS [Diatrype stigma]|uniref:Type I Iterative PKS n=1 Tax=Diatrype stigma TaxID=117547 RepID=A0AAN9UV96_9PEZI